MIEDFLKKEKDAIFKGNKIKIISIEEKFNKSLKINGLNFPINIRGTVDRIDVYNNTLRIIDYKSGLVKPQDLIISDFEQSYFTTLF